MLYLICCTVAVTLISYDFNSLSADATLRRFDGYKVYRLKPKTLRQLAFLHGMATNATVYSASRTIDFWKMPTELDSEVDVMVAPDVKAEVEKAIDQLDIESK